MRGISRSAKVHVCAVLALLVFSGSLAQGLDLVAVPRGPYTAPSTTDLNADPAILEVNLTAKEADVTYDDGKVGHMQTFNGDVPGPTLRAKVGDTFIAHFKNELTHATGIHWHGIELPNSMDGTPLTQNMVPAGGTFLYKFKFLRPGLYWYHPHHHSSTNQVFKGMYGMIVVEDPNEAALIAAGTLPAAADTKQLVLSDATFCKTSLTNDTQTYSNALPYAKGPPFAAQPAPTPEVLCQKAGEGLGAAVDEDGNPVATSYALGDVPAIQNSGNGRTNEGQTVLTNGRFVGGRAATQGAPNAVAANDSTLSALGATTGADLLNVQPGQGLRLQLVNASAVRYMRLRLTQENGTKVDLIRIGGEGGLLNKAIREGSSSTVKPARITQGETLLPPGTRADVVAAIPAGASGVMTLWTQDYQRTGAGGGWTNTPTVPVAHLNVTGATVSPAFGIADGTPLRNATGNPVTVLGAATSNLLAADSFAPAKIGKKAAVQPIALTNNGGTLLGVNGIQGAHDTADYATAPHMGPAPPGDGSSRYARLGETLELTVFNNTGANHPFHPHGFSIQPLSLTHAADPDVVFPADNLEFRDNFDIPPGYTLTYRVKLDDREQPDGTTAGGGLGRWVFHCHIFFHATLGMVSEFVVLPAGLAATDGDERPNINTNVTSVTVNQGETASFTGTYNDINGGDVVTLSSSVGSMTDNGGGNYTWSFPTGTAASQFVYVTATDADGAKVQLPVELKINNAAPALALPAAQSVAQGANLSFDITATDADAVDPLALTASGLPAGMTFKDNGNRTGTASGQVTDPPGSANPQFTVNDGRNAAVNGSVGVTITPPVMAALVGKRERLVKRRITVGCRFVLPSISTCGATATRGKANAEVGKAAATAATAGRSSLNVRVPLNRKTRRAVAKSVPGVKVGVNLSAARTDQATAFTGAKSTRVVAPRVGLMTAFKAFTTGAKMTNRLKALLAKIAKQVGTAKRIICTAHPNQGSNSKPVAEARAKAACAALKAGGLKAKFRSVGSLRTHNHRLELTILR